MQRDEKSGVGVFVCLGVVLLMLYPLSTGPFVWLTVHEYISQSTAGLLEGTIYLPVKWLVDKSELVEAALTWYLSLWIQI